MTKGCNKCLLHDRIPSIQINDDGLCQFCADYDEQLNQYKKKYAKKKLFKYLDEISSEKSRYDCIVMFSGGKDSSRLLEIARDHYNLKTIAVSIEHPLLNETAKRNIKKRAEELDVELLQVRIKQRDYKAIMRNGIVNAEKYNLEEFMGCYICSNLFKWTVIQYAMMLDVPLVMDGTDASQLEEPYYIDCKKVRNDEKTIKKPLGVIHDIIHDALGCDYANSIFAVNESMVKQRFPSVVAPFTFDEFGVTSAKEFEYNKIFTNCDLVPFLSVISLDKFNAVPYLRHYSNEIRTGNINILQMKLYQEKNETLTKEDFQVVLEEYRNTVSFITQNLDKNFDNDEIRKIIYGLAPNYIRIFGETVCNSLLEDLKKIGYYSEYFNIPIKRIGV